MFVYGVNEDKDLETQLAERAGPFISFDSGNVIGLGPCLDLRKKCASRPSDALRLVRTWWQISQETARDYDLYQNSVFGRCRHPNRWGYDNYMYAAALGICDSFSEFMPIPNRSNEFTAKIPQYDERFAGRTA